MDDHQHSACPERESALEALLFGEIPDQDRADLEAHIASCPGCAQALAESRDGLAALGELEVAPLPYPAVRNGGRTAETAWTDFRRRLRQERLPTRPPLWKLAAAAALLVAGVGIGRFALPTASRPASLVALEDQAMTLGVAGEAVDALARAEVLIELGIPYMETLRGVVSDVLEMQVGEVREEALLAVREQARGLIADGRVLRTMLAPDLDGEFLRAVGRAELLLEEIAAMERAAGGTMLLLVQNELRASDLGGRLASLDVRSSAQSALRESGWIGEGATIGMGEKP